MSRRLLCGAIGCALAATSAVAADLRVKAPPPLYSPVSIYNWAGFYGGVHVGAAGGEFRNNVPTTSGPAGEGGNVMGGAQLGYNWQFNQWVLGVEADASLISIRASSPGRSFDEHWMATVRGRVGYAWNRYLLYVTAGVGFTGIEAAITPFTQQTTATGFAGGFGFETFLWTPSWIGRVEYLFVDVPKQTFTLPSGTIIGGSYNHIGRAALNYKF